mgnify:CR=1 FL=1
MGAGEICAVVDSANSFDPCSAVLAGVETRRPDMKYFVLLAGYGEIVIRVDEAWIRW